MGWIRLPIARLSRVLPIARILDSATCAWLQSRKRRRRGTRRLTFAIICFIVSCVLRIWISFCYCLRSKCKWVDRWWMMDDGAMSNEQWALRIVRCEVGKSGSRRYRHSRSMTWWDCMYLLVCKLFQKISPLLLEAEWCKDGWWLSILFQVLDIKI